MHSPASFAPLFMAVTALAAPSLFQRDHVCPKNGHTTSKDWCSKIKADNVAILVSDTKINYGTVNPGDLIKVVRDNCSKNGHCKPGPWSLQTQWITNPEGDENDKGFEEGEVTVSVESQDDNPKYLDGMLESLQYTLDRLKTFKIEHKHSTSSCGPSGCAGSPALDLENTRGPSEIVIEVRDDDKDGDSLWDRGIIASLTLQFKLEKANDESSGLCSLITGAGAAIAGGVNGVLGGLGGLAALICND